MNQRTAASAMIDDQLCCQLLQGLVEIESYSGNESKAVAYAIDQMSRLGYGKAYVDSAGNAVGVQPASRETLATIALLGHIDTVKGRIPVRVEKGVLYGRGSVDAKGPLAAFILAGAMVQLPPEIELVVVGAVEEESATSKGARQIVKDFQADHCVIGEPSGADAITLGYKGRLLVDYQIAVEEGHTAGPQHSAAEIAADFWQDVRQYADEFNRDKQRLFDQLLPSLRRFNTQSDGLTASANLLIGCRLPPEFPVNQFENFLHQKAGAATISTHGYERAHQQGRSGPLVNSFSTAIRQETGRTAQFKHKTGTSDMNVVAPVWNCPILAYGPGDSSLDHTPHEHLSLAEFLQSVRLLKQAIELLAHRVASGP